jgi:putative FmdB family regulatory protein
VPIYEYECNACKGRVEVMQRLSDAALSVCSTCGGALHKLISPSGLMFKGAGWYITDYARKSETPAKKEESTGEKKSPESSTSSESKPAESKEPAKTPSETPSKTPAAPAAT